MPRTPAGAMVEGPPRVAIEVFDTTFQNPVLLSAGTAGFGREVAAVIAVDRLGGVVTKAVSREPRSGHRAPRVAEFPGGMLNAVGLANPGLERVLADELPWLARHTGAARIIVNVVGSSVDDFVHVTEHVTRAPAVSAVELNVSCPNTEQGGQEFGADLRVLAQLVQRCREVSERPIIVKLAPDGAPLEQAVDVATGAGADGFTLVNTLPSALVEEARDAASRLGYGRGGVSGPKLLPLGVQATRMVRERTGLPVIGVGGVRSYADALEYLDAGASLVAIGTAALANPRLPEQIAASWVRDG